METDYSRMRDISADEYLELEAAAAECKEKALKTLPDSVLEAFELIVELAENSNLDSAFFEKAAVPVGYASRKLDLSPMQTVLLALFVDRSEDTNIRISEIAGYVGCRTTRMLRLSKDIDILEKGHYLRSSNRFSDLRSYRVPEEVLKSLKVNQPYAYVDVPVMDTAEFFDRFNDLMSDMENRETTYEEVLGRTEEYLEEIKDTCFARSLKKADLLDEDRLLFIFMAHLYVENSDDGIGFHDIGDLYDGRKIPSRIKAELRSRRSSLFEVGFIENVNENGMARPDCFKLTEYAKTEVLSELNLDVKAKSDNFLLKSGSFAEKKLVYNPSERAQVVELSEILSGERFADVQSRLKNAGMRPGFCCLFYGSPGTGKTETVYQLARATGRDIMRVDVDKIKSCWVGESEQNMKKLFDRYRNICKDSELAPILLFNEADAVLGVRMEGAVRAVDKMENSIQNIILQEMETLDGIMIATTNLTTNLDKAFERRFLYKIRFSRPTAEARAQIWRSMIPSLGESDACELASRFDLSGGEIENIARKCTVNAILSGKDSVGLPAMLEICGNEKIAGQGAAKIGFR